MNILGHAGLTVGAAYAAGYLFNAMWASGHSPQPSESRGPLTDRRVNSGAAHHLQIDYRLVLIGAWLPDIVDKPLAFWLLPHLVNESTRSFGHTLLFNLGLLVVALLVFRVSSSYRPLWLALGSAFHLVLDQMWLVPKAFLWPLYGWSFPPGSTSFQEYLLFLLPKSLLSLEEMAGAAILLWFVVHLYRQSAVLQFLKVGTLR